MAQLNYIARSLPKLERWRFRPLAAAVELAGSPTSAIGDSGHATDAGPRVPASRSASLHNTHLSTFASRRSVLHTALSISVLFMSALTASLRWPISSLRA